jgi:hypothetical protein
MKTERRKPTVYIASPYTGGDTAINTHFQCKVFDKLLHDKKVLPVAPLWSHFQHTLFPRPYADWIEYDQQMLSLYDCCLRLDSEIDMDGYLQSESAGAEAEVKTFKNMGKPVFYSILNLYDWVDNIPK